MADYYLPEEEVHTRKYSDLLKDIWWAMRTRSGSVFKAPITRYGANGLPDGETSPELEISYNRENVASLKWQQEQDNKVTQEKLDKILEKLEGK